MADEKLIYTPKDPKLARTLEDLLQRINDLQEQVDNIDVSGGMPGAHAITHYLAGSDELDHDLIKNGHNLTTDIDHDQLTNFDANEHFLQSAIVEVGTIATGVWQGTPLSSYYFNPYYNDHTRGSVFSSTVVGSYVDTAVHLAVTPTYNCKALITLHTMVKKSVTGGYILSSINEATLGTIACGYYHAYQANEYKQLAMTRMVELNASVAYDFKFQMFQNAAGTMYCLQNPYTYMTIVLFGR